MDGALRKRQHCSHRRLTTKSTAYGIRRLVLDILPCLLYDTHTITFGIFDGILHTLCWVRYVLQPLQTPSIMLSLGRWVANFLQDSSNHLPGCRSMTVLVYMLCQLILISLWIIDIESSQLDENGIPQTPYTQSPFKRNGQKPPWRSRIWYAVATITGLVSTFITIGGTMMQIMGVYRNCLCSVPISQWHNPWEAFLDISSNSAEDIRYARRTWTSLGAAAVTFLGIVSFIGWWYQKRLRFQMRRMIGTIGKNAQDWVEATAGFD